MKRSFAVGGATFAFMLAIALSFGANSAEAQLLCRVKSCCSTPAKACAPAKRLCLPKIELPKLSLPTACCKPAKKCCEAKPAVKCCEAKPAKECCEAKNPCCPMSRLMAKLKCRTPKLRCCAAKSSCSGCDADAETAEEKEIPPAPEATDAKPTT